MNKLEKNPLANILQIAQVGNLFLVGNRVDSLAYTGHGAENAVVTKNYTTGSLVMITTTSKKQTHTGSY